MTEYSSDGLPVYRPSKEDLESFEQEEERINALLRKSKRKRAQLKDLMRNRTTVEQGLTLWEIFFHVYSDVVNEFHDENALDPSSYNLLGCYSPIYDMYIRRLIKHVR